MLDIVGTRGKMHNPVTGSGGMLIGTVAETGPCSPLGLKPGDRVASLVSLTLTPLTLTDGLRDWDGLSERARSCPSAPESPTARPAGAATSSHRAISQGAG